jgi:hypothetical protein
MRAGRCAARERIRAVHAEWDGACGRPRITAELREEGDPSATSPASRQRAKKAYTRGQGGKSDGIARHLMPLSTR